MTIIMIIVMIVIMIIMITQFTEAVSKHINYIPSPEL